MRRHIESTHRETAPFQRPSAARHDTMAPPPKATLRVQLLGLAGAEVAPSVLVTTDKEGVIRPMYLFNAPEGLARAALEHKVLRPSRGRIMAIFLSGLSPCEASGLPGLILRGRTDGADASFVFGPVGTVAWLHAHRHVVRWVHPELYAVEWGRCGCARLDGGCCHAARAPKGHTVDFCYADGNISVYALGWSRPLSGDGGHTQSSATSTARQDHKSGHHGCHGTESEAVIPPPSLPDTPAITADPLRRTSHVSCGEFDRCVDAPSAGQSGTAAGAPSTEQTSKRPRTDPVRSSNSLFTKTPIVAPTTATVDAEGAGASREDGDASASVAPVDTPAGCLAHLCVATDGSSVLIVTCRNVADFQRLRCHPALPHCSADGASGDRPSLVVVHFVPLALLRSAEYTRWKTSMGLATHVDGVAGEGCDAFCGSGGHDHRMDEERVTGVSDESVTRLDTAVPLVIGTIDESASRRPNTPLPEDKGVQGAATAPSLGDIRQVLHLEAACAQALNHAACASVYPRPTALLSSSQSKAPEMVPAADPRSPSLSAWEKPFDSANSVHPLAVFDFHGKKLSQGLDYEGFFAAFAQRGVDDLTALAKDGFPPWVTCGTKGRGWGEHVGSGTNGAQHDTAEYRERFYAPARPTRGFDEMRTDNHDAAAKLRAELMMGWSDEDEDKDADAHHAGETTTPAIATTDYSSTRCGDDHIHTPGNGCVSANEDAAARLRQEIGLAVSAGDSQSDRSSGTDSLLVPLHGAGLVMPREHSDAVQADLRERTRGVDGGMGVGADYGKSASTDCDVGRDDAPTVMFLGTGCAEPSKQRASSAIIVSVPYHGTLMLDAGEGTVARLVSTMGLEEAMTCVATMRCVWISHHHPDHCAGILGVIALRARAAPEGPPLPIIGPRAVGLWINEAAAASGFGGRYHTFHTFREFSHISGDNGYGGSGDSGGGARSGGGGRGGGGGGAVYAEVAQALGLSSFASVPVEHCHDAHAAIVTSTTGWRIVFSGDTRPCPRLIRAGASPSLLIHEATFNDDMHHQAVSKRHSTMTEALSVATSMQATRVVLTHFSQRTRHVALPPGHENAVCAEDGMTITLRP